jgi:hypothetical protein
LDIVLISQHGVAERYIADIVTIEEKAILFPPQYRMITKVQTFPGVVCSDRTALPLNEFKAQQAHICMIAGHMTLFVAHSRHSFFTRPYPAPIFLIIILATQCLAAMIVGFGWLVAPIPVIADREDGPAESRECIILHYSSFPLAILDRPHFPEYSSEIVYEPIYPARIGAPVDFEREMPKLLEGAWPGETGAVLRRQT